VDKAGAEEAIVQDRKMALQGKNRSHRIRTAQFLPY
jgi:hypothetical protein